jgi:putative Mg2+ transporter-C (MgtC) family protein
MTVVGTWEIMARLALASVLGLLIGLERELAGLPAGLRTHGLAALGAAGFGVISVTAFPTGDPGRVAAGVAVGIGFLGAGLILKRDDREVIGLTTAAGIWTVGAVGLAVGCGLYLAAIGCAALVLLILTSERALRLNRHFRQLRTAWMARDSVDDGDVSSSR